ncbi:MAG: cysteine synthase A [Candidatus Thorarchaeota archaeon]|jgi:cysteine synthase A
MTHKIYDSIVSLVGNTPIVRLQRIGQDLGCELLVKLESFNPMASVKDRIAKSMIEAAEKDNLLRKGTTIVEPTSGNTGIGLAMVSAAKGYELILVMPDTMSLERQRILTALGAQLVLTPGSEGMAGAISRAGEIASQEPNKFYIPQQFNNPANPIVHMETTAKEILEATEGQLDCFVSGVGTGGTVTGVGRVLKKEITGIRIVAVEPEESPILSRGEKGPHKIQGIGAGFVPEVLDRSVIDEIMTVSYELAAKTTRLLARQEGIFAGVSSGAALWAALESAKKLGNKKRILVMLPDTGERYLSTDLFTTD